MKCASPCPLEEGDKGLSGNSKNIPLGEGVAEGRGRLFPEACEGGAESQENLAKEKPPVFPMYRRLYNPRLQPVANQLRKRMTKAEACLWKYALRAGQMMGYTFNRQRPVLRYVADFMCKPLYLIIEVDGSSHLDSKVQKHDMFRQQELEACGFTILRFTNEEVLRTIDEVKMKIASKVAELKRS
jgi:very-short-patch-repair endonuclease